MFEICENYSLFFKIIHWCPYPGREHLFGLRAAPLLHPHPRRAKGLRGRAVRAARAGPGLGLRERVLAGLRSRP